MVSIGYLVVNVGLFGDEELDRRERIANDLVDADVRFLQSPRGPRVVESMLEEEWAVTGLLEAVDTAEDDVDAFVIGCFGDPGLAALREYTRVPVVGPAEVACHTAAMVGDRFSVLNLTEETVPLMERVVRGYRIADQLASCPTLDVGVADIDHDSERLADQMIEAGRSAVDADRADALVPGCMGLAFMRVHDRITTELGVPFVDPVSLSLETAATWARHGITQSPTSSPNVDRSRLDGLFRTAVPNSDH
jgi:allantoin racemase